MKGSISSLVDDYVKQLSAGSFVTADDFDHPRGAVDTALSRICAGSGLLRARKGLYWKGAQTRFGMTRPTMEEVALKVGGPGSGPAGIAAAHWLGLTTQVPATFTAAVPVRAPKPWGSVRFTKRSFGRRLRELQPAEVAVVEVLRAGPSVVETDWTQLTEIVSSLAECKSLRTRVLDEQIRDEHHTATRTRWSELLEAAPALNEATA